MEVRTQSGVRTDDGGCEAAEVTVKKQVRDGGEKWRDKGGGKEVGRAEVGARKNETREVN